LGDAENAQVAIRLVQEAVDNGITFFDNCLGISRWTKRGVAVLGMKSLGGSGEIVVNGAVTHEEGLRYAMSLPVATTISGMDSLRCRNRT